jgi:ribosomal protein L21
MWFSNSTYKCLPFSDTTEQSGICRLHIMLCKDVPEDPAEVVIECMDIMAELNKLEQNMITIEAAKTIRKAKSASRKKKIVISKMKAKRREGQKEKRQCRKDYQRVRCRLGRRYRPAAYRE